MGAFKLFQQSTSSGQLIAVSMREVIFMCVAPCDLWIYIEGDFQLFLNKNQEVKRGVLRDIIRKGIYQLFVEPWFLDIFRKSQQENLRESSRGLSIGNPFKNVQNQMALLSINMEYLYKSSSSNGESLSLQYQSARNLVNFLSANKKSTPQFYREFAQQEHHYIIAHPLLSSLLLVSFLQSLYLFSEREEELLFLTNYFKDIGMSLIPIETFDKKSLSFSERTLISEHTQHSVHILRGHIPLNENYLNIIANHHNHSLIQAEANHRSHKVGRGPNILGDGLVEGIETVFVVMVDMMTAMISPRPYRSGMDLFTALNTIKILFADDYRREFYHLVHFLQQFFSRTK